MTTKEKIDPELYGVFLACFKEWNKLDISPTEQYTLFARVMWLFYCAENNGDLKSWR